MAGSDPVELLFGGMEKLGPGDDTETLRVLHMLPRQRFDLIVDAGCGSGRQTLALAGELGTTVHALDIHEPFLAQLAQRSRLAGIASLVHTHLMDINDIPGEFDNIDLLWSEGAAYNIGFAHALAIWAPAICAGGFAVISELTWLSGQAPAPVREFFVTGYPGMNTLDANVACAGSAGYEVLATHTIPRACWVDGYYEVLEPRARSLVDHPDEPVRQFAADTLREIEIFRIAEDSYGYVFYLLQRH